MRRILPRAVSDHLPLKFIKNRTFVFNIFFRRQSFCDAESKFAVSGMSGWSSPSSGGLPGPGVSLAPVTQTIPLDIHATLDTLLLILGPLVCTACVWSYCPPTFHPLQTRALICNTRSGNAWSRGVDCGTWSPLLLGRGEGN